MFCRRFARFPDSTGALHALGVAYDEAANTLTFAVAAEKARGAQRGWWIVDTWSARFYDAIGHDILATLTLTLTLTLLTLSC